MSNITKESSPRISIVCPVRNVEKYIETTIKSVLAQTYQDWELLVMDGASTDHTAAIVKKYSDRDPRIKFYSEPDESNWEATERGVARAQGEFLDIIAGQDGFLDKEWLASCMKILDADKSISLVSASTRGMGDDGELLSKEHITYSHLTRKEGKIYAAWYVVRKIFYVLRDLLFGGPDRRKILFKKMFSRTAVLKMNFLTRRGFPGGRSPQKEEWFSYWLDTGFMFSDQASCVSRRVYLECAPRYPKGSRLMNHVTDFTFNFNSRGYLAYYVPMLATYGRMHPGNSGDRIPGEVHDESEKYLQKVFDFRKKVLDGHEEMTFIDREGKPVSKRRF